MSEDSNIIMKVYNSPPRWLKLSTSQPLKFILNLKRVYSILIKQMDVTIESTCSLRDIFLMKQHTCCSLNQLIHAIRPQIILFTINVIDCKRPSSTCRTHRHWSTRCLNKSGRTFH